MGEAIGGIAQGAGAIAGAQAQAGALKEQAAQQLLGTQLNLAEQGREFDVTNGQTQATQAARQKAYAEAIARGQQGESQLISESNTPSAQLEQQSADIASGNAKELQQGASQMGANLATQGVRGGQSATLLNRGTGTQAIEAQKNVNTMKYQDEATKKAQLRAYYASKAGGQTPGTGVSF